MRLMKVNFFLPTKVKKFEASAIYSGDCGPMIKKTKS